MSPEHIFRQYDQDLEALRSGMLRMGGLVETQIRDAVDGFSSGDPAVIARVMEREAEVDVFELDLDRSCSRIIVLRQPAAGDLRLIMAISKTITDLERMGDEAEKIARMSAKLHQRTVAQPHALANIRHTADIAVRMLRGALDAFARLDPVQSQAIIRDDLAIDVEFESIVRQLITFMMEDARTISTALDIVWIAKAVERIGDHAKNIAENVIYIVEGTDVRHIRRSPEPAPGPSA
jgi:phosphate transport system protein